MIIFNTTYLVARHQENNFLQRVKNVHASMIQGNPLVSQCRLFKVLAENPEGISYSFQIEADSVSMMNEFKKRYQDEIGNRITNGFGEDVLSFSTYLKEHEL